MRPRSALTFGFVCVGVVLAAGLVIAREPTARAMSYAEARGVVESLPDAALPAALGSRSSDERQTEWPTWVARRDAAIRARVARGDEDSVVNLVLYGVSFTAEPRLTEREAALGFGTRRSVVTRRIRDLANAAARRADSERLRFVRDLLRNHDADVATDTGQRKARALLARWLDRYSSELGGFVQASEKGERLATLFSERGLSSDTSIYPGFAVEQSLEALRAADLIAPVRRVAIVGPGLDFADKREGLDIYHEQSIQPFAIVDSLLRLHLATAADLQVTTFDLSPRVNHHLDDAVDRAQRGEWYRLELPRSRSVMWNRELVAYWERFGDQIGVTAEPTVAPKLAGQVTSRAVRVRPDIAGSLSPRDLNIVLEQPKASETGAFDLIVVTNTLIYYDRFEQLLALSNIARLLHPGGWLLVNDAPVPLSSIPLTLMGWTDLTYSDQVNSHDRLTWYQR
jgi:hypothetical protein